MATGGCADCGAPLDEVPLGSERPPCPNCGSTRRKHFKELTAHVELHDKLAGKVRSGGKGKPRLEFVVGADLHRATGRWNQLERVVDRGGDWYREVVKDSETGRVIHATEEPLSRHQGHGSAKRARKQPGKRRPTTR
jgi:hypothetical protein